MYKKKGVTKTPAISPASKTPAQPCLYYENTCYRKFTKTLCCITKELDITRSKDHRIRNRKYI